jgi:hypothetical protein
MIKRQIIITAVIALLAGYGLGYWSGQRSEPFSFINASGRLFRTNRATGETAVASGDGWIPIKEKK